MADASAALQNTAFAYQQSTKVAPTIGGDAPWFDKGLSALISIGSAFGTLELQKREIDNAYKYAGISSGLYNAPGGQYSGATPWLGVTGPAPAGGAPRGFSIDPLMIVAIVAVVGVGAFVLLKD